MENCVCAIELHYLIHYLFALFFDGPLGTESFCSLNALTPGSYAIVSIYYTIYVDDVT